MKIERRDILKMIDSGTLLIPGFLNAVFSLLLASNRLFPDKAHSTFLLLSIAQMQGLGITIAKYGADQMILTRIIPGNVAAVKDFFKRRVLPLSLLFAVVVVFIYKNLISLTFLLAIPLEVYVIITILELNVSKKYYQSLGLNIIGYPFIFATFIFFSFNSTLKSEHIFLIFIVSSIVRFAIAFLIRKKYEKQEGVLLFSKYVPVQQITNYFIFRADYIIISSNLMMTFFFPFAIPNDYLFYTRFTEIYSGVATSLGPILAREKSTLTGSSTEKPFYKKKLYLLIMSMLLSVQIIVTAFMLLRMDIIHILLLIPFTLVTILIVPVNLINYNFYRIGNLKLSSRISFVCFFVSGLVILINMFVKSSVLFAFIVPIQLGLFVLISHYNKLNRNV